MNMEKIRILLVEDTPTDAELTIRALTREGIQFESRLVSKRDDFLDALKTYNPDAILSDFSLPDFDGRKALKLAKEFSPAIPFILVSGAIGEEIAVDIIKEGADDYVFKDRLGRLPSTLLHAIEEKKLKKENQLANERFRIIFQNARDGIVLVDENGFIAECNEAFELQTGRTLEELQKMHIWEIRPPEHREIARNKFFEIIDTGEGGSNDLAFQKPDGSLVYIEFRAKSVSIGGKKYYQSISRDITSQKEEKEKLKKSERNLKEAQRMARLGSWELDIKKNILTWSDEIFSIFEIDPEEFKANYEAFLDAVHPEDREKVHSAYTGTIKNHTHYDIKHRLLMPDGRIKYVHEICITDYDADGKPLRSTGTVQDMTEQHESEIRINHLNRTLRTISACNESLVRAESEDVLLKEICANIVKYEGHILAWIGLYENGNEKFKPAYYDGDKLIYEAIAQFSASSRLFDKCLSIMACKTLKTMVINRFEDSDEFSTTGFLRDMGVNAILSLPLISGKNIFGALTILSKYVNAFDADEINLMEELSADIGYGLNSFKTRKERDEFMRRYSTAMQSTIEVISRTIEMRDPYTAGHQTRVGHLAHAIALEMGLPEERAEGIYLAGIVHDIGKIKIPAEILSKPGRLSDLDFSFIKTHSEAGYEILKDVEFPFPIAQIVYQHHERVDGSGYPRNLKGDEIMLESKILHVADVVEAMSSHRPYRPSLGIEAALEEITKMSGIHFDPHVVDACLTLFKERNYSFSA